MKAQELNSEDPRSLGRRSSGSLYRESAFIVALILVGIGFIPSGDSSTQFILGSFGRLFILFVSRPLFHVLDPLLSHQPDWLTVALFIVVGVLYILILTLPFYFYFRTRRRFFLVFQALLFAVHCAVAWFVVAPYWIHL